MYCNYAIILLTVRMKSLCILVLYNNFITCKLYLKGNAAYLKKNIMDENDALSEYNKIHTLAVIRVKCMYLE